MRNALLYRLIIFNACCMAATVYAWKLGYLAHIEGGAVPYVIVALFGAGMLSTFFRGYKLSKTINDHKACDYRGPEKTLFAEHLAAKQEHINSIADWLIYISLIGTAVGIAVIAGNPNASNDQLRVAVFDGLHIALPATIMGITLALWTSVNFQMLDTAIRLHLADVRR